MEIFNNVTVSGNSLYYSETLAAKFLRSRPSYVPELDPRLPLHDTLASNLTPTATSIVVSNISLYPSPNVSIAQVGRVRVGAEVIWYSNRFTGNSTLANITRNIAGTAGSNITSNITAGSIVSILGLKEV